MFRITHVFITKAELERERWLYKKLRHSCEKRHGRKWLIFQ
jgi:hypothetical protein